LQVGPYVAKPVYTLSGPTVTDNFGNTIPLNTALPLSVKNTPLSGFWNCTNVTPVTVNASTTSDQNLMSCLIGYPTQWLSFKQDAAHPLEGHLFHPGVFYSDHQLEDKVLPRERVRVGRRHHPGKHNVSRFGLDPSHEQSFPFRREHHDADQRVIGGL
jgi:hypothetical protein